MNITRYLKNLFLALILGTSLAVQAKVIIWDIGYTLFRPSKNQVAAHLGYWDCFCIYFKHGNHTHKVINDLFFDVLSDGTEKQDPFAPCSPNGHLLPRLMCDWFTGSKTSEEILDQAIKRWTNYPKFTSNRCKRMLLSTLQWMFDPWLFAMSMKPIPQAAALLKECARTKKMGTATNSQYIISNLDAESFVYMYKRKANNPVFKHFKPQHIYISAFMQDIKPHPSLFKTFLKRTNHKPSECIVIDDQLDNLEAARACGMTGIHVKDGDYNAVRRELKKLGAL